MKNNKGQALVEFVIVVPILIFIIMAIVDFGNIAYKKMRLENNLNDVVTLYQNKDLEKINLLSQNEKFDVSYTISGDTTSIILKQYVKVFTPFLNLILSDNYLLQTTKVIYNE